MADTIYGYVNEKVKAMYGIPYSQLTEEQRKILHEDSLRRAKLIKERQEAVIKNNLKAFDDEAKMEKVLASIYRDCQKQILADVAETVAKVKKAGGTWSYANQSALTRSRGLFEQIGQEITKLGQKEQGIFTKGLSNIYTDQFCRQIYELGQSIPVKANFNRLNPALVKKTLDYPWSGAMFSDRLWQDKATLGRNLRVGLTQSMILGEGIPEMTDRINKGIDTARYNAERVARTETKRVTYCAHNDAYEDMGVDELEYRCANGGDNRVCSLCRADQGKHYKRGEEPTLPRHPNCRCVYIPVVSDTFGDNELNELTGSVRGAENYEKWKENEVEKQKRKEPQNTEGKNDKVIQLEKEKSDIQMQIDTKNEEYKNVSSKYQAEIDDLEVKRADAMAKANAKQAELEKYNIEKDKIAQRRLDVRQDYYENQKLSEDEYEDLMRKLREERKKIVEESSKVEGEYYELWDKINEYSSKLSEIHTKINVDREKIKDELSILTRKLNDVDTKLALLAKNQYHSESYIEVMKVLKENKVEAKVVPTLSKELSDKEIIDKLGGGDMTKGSCSSLAFSYIGNKNGMDVIDYRGGISQACFSRNSLIQAISNLDGVKSTITKVKYEIKDTVKILQALEKDKEYYLAVGKHAAIVRNTDHGLEYLELQSGFNGYPNGWTSFDRYGTIQQTLAKRFGCRKTVDKLKIGDTTMIFEKSVVLMDVSSFSGNAEFKEILSYINTDPDKQKKGAAGSVK